MQTLLHISASPRTAASQSRRAGQLFLDRLRAAGWDAVVVRRDLADPPLPHPGGRFAEASLMLAAERGPAQDAALALSETLIGELEAADLVLIDTPMHNFTAPSTLKAWIDHVVRPRRTFGFSPAGKVGLLPDRPVLVLVACGGAFEPDRGAQADFLGPYLEYTLGTIGLVRVAVRRLEKLSRGESSVTAAFESATRWIDAQIAALP
jgi:FMN-dependent NADH-azoreductase